METQTARKEAPAKKIYIDDIDKMQSNSADDDLITPTENNRNVDQGAEVIKKASEKDIREVEENDGVFRSKKPILIDSSLKDDTDNKDKLPVLEVNKKTAGNMEQGNSERIEDQTVSDKHNVKIKNIQKDTKQDKSGPDDNIVESERIDKEKSPTSKIISEKKSTKKEGTGSNGSSLENEKIATKQIDRASHDEGVDEKDSNIQENETTTTKNPPTNDINAVSEYIGEIHHNPSTVKPPSNASKTIVEKSETVSTPFDKENSKNFFENNENMSSSTSNKSEQRKGVKFGHDHDEFAPSIKLANSIDTKEDEKKSYDKPSQHNEITTKSSDADKNVAIEKKSLITKKNGEETVEEKELSTELPKNDENDKEKDDENSTKLREGSSTTEKSNVDKQETIEKEENSEETPPSPCSGCNEPPINKIKPDEPEKENKGLLKKIKESFMSEEEKKEQKYYTNINKANKEIGRECKATTKAEKYAKKAEKYLELAQEKLKEKEDAHRTAEGYQEKAIIEAERAFELSEMDLSHKADEIEKTATKFHDKPVET